MTSPEKVTRPIIPPRYVPLNELIAVWLSLTESVIVTSLLVSPTSPPIFNVYEPPPVKVTRERLLSMVNEPSFLPTSPPISPLAVLECNVPETSLFLINAEPWLFPINPALPSG